MRILFQPGSHMVGEPGEPVRPPGLLARDAITDEIRPDRPTIPAQMTANLRDRPPSSTRGMNFNVLLLYEHEQKGGSSQVGDWPDAAILEGSACIQRSHAGGEIR